MLMRAPRFGFNGDLKNREGTVSNVTVGAISVNDPTVVFLARAGAWIRSLGTYGSEARF